ERVVDVADPAERGGRGPDHPDRLDAAAELLRERGVLGVDRGAVTHAVELDHLLREPDAVLTRGRAQDRQDRAELLPGQWLLRADLGDLGEDDRRLGRHGEAGLLGDPLWALADGSRVELGAAAARAGLDTEDEALELGL